MAGAAAAALDEAHRRDWALVLASTVRVTRDLDVAEDCVQHAYTQALTSWERHGVPRNPAAWLTTVARNRALDVRRREATATRKLPLLVDDPVESEPAGSGAPGDIPDERLRLVCTCCHPALSLEAQIALTLRLVCGLTTGEVARAFLVAETTMAARITRAKKKIAAARIPYRVPPAAELPERIRAVLEVVHLLYTTGHTAPLGEAVRRAPLVERAFDLAQMLRVLLPEDEEVAGLLALILLTDARQAARVGRDGELVLLADQDRSLWDRAAIGAGLSLLAPQNVDGKFGLMAAIAAVHSAAPSWDATDWPRLVGLYDRLLERWPSPVVALNRAVAVGFAHGPEAGLVAIDALGDDTRVATYRYLASARADFLRRLGRLDDARLAYEEAMLLTDNSVERRFLQRQLQELDG
ncbi:MAG: hypothetical protein J2P57_13805 [Acidimicrobiaceae bacterium]|nr:hypothetical protein [Acidimicrobiaceae bacterium]